MTEKLNPKPYGSPVVGYVRSARRGDPALDEAEARIRAFCAERGWNLAKVFREEGVSGVATWRPQFEEMVRTLERRECVGLALVTYEHVALHPATRRRLVERLVETGAWIVVCDTK